MQHLPLGLASCIHVVHSRSSSITVPLTSIDYFYAHSSSSSRASPPPGEGRSVVAAMLLRSDLSPVL
uniref:Putative secreted protein n=1 Tax=Anopheles marajoara TaxID=58244 RepID=A0A2M4CFY8_9DIPT